MSAGPAFIEAGKSSNRRRQKWRCVTRFSGPPSPTATTATGESPRSFSDQGFMVSAKKVRRLMREDNLMAIRRRKFVVTTDSDHRFRVHPNLAQSLELTEHQSTLGGGSHLLAAGAGIRVFGRCPGRLFQASRRMGVRADARSKPDLGGAGKGDYRPGAQAGPHPSLRPGSARYACQSYVDRLESCGAVLSMSRPGRPWENGRCESFIKTLKHEELDARQYRTLEELRDHVTEFIEQIYNLK